MHSNAPSFRRFSAAIQAFALLAALAAAAPARAGDESCRQWLREHCDWKAKAISRYLRGAPQRELDAAVFELLQREAYLTSCEVPAEVSRAPMVGWRLVGRAPDDYAAAVLESVLERAGLGMDLRRQLSDAAETPLDATPVYDATNGALAASPYAQRRSAGVAR